jgi:ubiquinone/menaquinone biosynthesis C-methylase UbiE
MPNSRLIFSSLTAQYDAARPSYPLKVIQFILDEIKIKRPLLLDLGCGTGISTRQLAKTVGMTIGCDIDGNMLNVAIEHMQKDTAYIQGDAHRLPFSNALFDAVTIFTAFHWFADRASLKEIYRVLKPSGKLFIVHPRLTTSYARELYTAIQEQFGKKIPISFSGYSSGHFQKTLSRNGFSSRLLPIVKQKMTYTLNRFLLLLQSYSAWNHVPELKRGSMIRLLRKRFQPKMKNGRVIDERDINIFVARKK